MTKTTKYFLVSILTFTLVCIWSLPLFAYVHSPAPLTQAQITQPQLATQPQLIANSANRFTSFIRADGLYRQGNVSAAQEIYRQLKPAFSSHSMPETAEPIYEATALSAGSQVYWNNALEAIGSNNERLASTSLELLTADQPEFIPGILARAEFLSNQGRQDESLELLNSAAARYPDAPDVVMDQVQALSAAGKHIEASIAAREFSILYLDHPQADEFSKLADDEMSQFQGETREQNILQGALNIGIGIFTGNRRPWESPGSAIETFELINLMLSDEKDFGAQAARQYREQLPILDIPEVTDYVKQLGLEMGRAMGRDFDYEFYVVQDNTPNAFALPGGKIFVNTGLIMATNSEAELAGVMAHEVAHSVLSHGIQGLFRGRTLAQVGELLGGQGSWGQLLTNLTDLHYSREQERQSDILGTRVLSTVGYAADGLRNFMSTLDQLGGSTQLEYFSSHPASSSRVTYLEELIQRNDYNRYALEGVDKHSQIQNRLSAA